MKRPTSIWFPGLWSKETIDQITAAQKTVDAAKKVAKAAKAAHREAKKTHKQARQIYKAAKRELKILKSDLVSDTHTGRTLRIGRPAPHPQRRRTLPGATPRSLAPTAAAAR